MDFQCPLFLHFFSSFFSGPQFSDFSLIFAWELPPPFSESHFAFSLCAPSVGRFAWLLPFFFRFFVYPISKRFHYPFFYKPTIFSWWACLLLVPCSFFEESRMVGICQDWTLPECVYCLWYLLAFFVMKLFQILSGRPWKATVYHFLQGSPLPLWCY